MIYGKYGEMIFKNMEKNYPIRKQELELTGQLEMKIFEREKVLKELNRAKSMLSNEKFVSKAPANLVEQEKMKVIKYEEMLNDIEKRIKELNSK